MAPTVSTMLRSRGTVCPAILLFLFAITSGELFAQYTSGIDCGCSTVGGYRNPARGVQVQVRSDSTSPNNKYKIYPSGTGPYTLVVRRVSDNVTVYSTTVPGGNWGFSPDDDRFVYFYLTVGSQLRIVLVDLTASSNKEIWERYTSASSVKLTFSPRGNYFLSSELTSSTSAGLFVVDTKTGDLSHNTSFTFAPGGDTTGVHGVASWGYSPDSQDRTLSYAFVTGQGVMQWRVVNLASHQIVQDQTEYLISGFWQFSPCGDVIGLVTEPTTSSMKIYLYKTLSTQAALADYPVAQVAIVALRAEESSHIANIGGSDVVLAQNGAGSTCVIGPDSLTLTPREVTGGGVSTGRVKLNAPAPSGGLAVSLSSSNTAAATVPATVVVPQDSLQQTFSVQSASVSSLTKVVISGSANSMTAKDTLTVLPLRLVSFTFNKTTVTGGDNVTARFTLSAEAPPGGASIALRSNKPSLVAPPSTALVHAGQTSDSISIATAAVTVIDSATISAIASGDTLKQTLRVYPPITLELIPDSVVGGNNVTFLVSRLDPAPAGGIVVPVASSDSSLFVAPTLTIPEGSTSIWANDIPTKGVDSPAIVVISSQAGTAAVSAELRIIPALLASFGARTDSGCAVAEPGGFRKRFLAGCTILFEAALDGEAPPAGGMMTISSSRPDLIGPNPNLQLAGYDRKGLFSVQTTGGISAAQEVVLTAMYRGITKSDTIILMPGPPFTLTDISQPGSTGYNYQAINNAGDVLIDGVFFWHDGDYFRLDTLPGFRLTGVTGMNDSAWFIGTVWNAGQSLNEAAYWKPDTTIMLPSLDGSHPQGNTVAINNRGEVIGTSSATTYPFESIPVTWKSGGVTALGAYLTYKLWPVALNDSGEVIGSGTYYQASPYINRQIAVRWNKSGAAAPIFHPWGVDFFIGGVSIASNRTALLAWPNQFFLEHDGTISPEFTPPPPHNRMTPYDMNDSYEVVGGLETYIEDVGTWYSCFIMRGGYVYDLKCLTDFPSGWTMPTATGINNSGTIVGWAEEGGEIRLFLLTPGGPTSVAEGRGADRIPDEFRLLQNFPNPFNPSTVIRYDLPHASDVRIEVFNLLGQSVLTLVEGWRSAGQYSARLNGSELATGVYIYRMKAGEFTQSRKMVLVK